MNGNGDPFVPGGGRGSFARRGRGRGRGGGHDYGGSALLANRRHTVTTAVPPLSPFNGDRALPSKWDDAERWICSPMSANNNTNNNSSRLLRNRPKSKSGPIRVDHPSNYFGYPGHLGGGFYSPAVPVLESWGRRSFFAAGSPFSAGVFVADQSLMMSCIDGTNNSGHRCLEERIEMNEDIMEDRLSRAVSRRDMATQMSPSSSVCISPKTRSSRHHSPPRTNLEEVRDVLMDRRSNVISWSKRHAARFKKKDRAVPMEWRDDEFSREVRASSTWDVAESGKSMSRIRREEAKIAAWENLQKAKAEAAIRKLEMKLERRRSSSVDRIQHKLRRAELKAQEMRCSISEEDPARDHPKDKRSSLRRHFQLKFLPRCFCFRSF